MTHSTRRPAISSLLFCATAALLLVPAALPAQSTPTPTDVFNDYRAALAKAASYSEVLSFMEAKGRTIVEAMPEPQQASMFGFLKRFAGTFTEVAVTTETVTGDTAVLTLSGKDPNGQPATGSVPMTKESSGWKVGVEKWSSKPR